ncbi:MAG: lytic transglycosylase domain-containing protein [Actinomycetota bacterium]|nr:lytic transglycosylase domain-containing protein [Actinomycetota bacterium]
MFTGVPARPPEPVGAPFAPRADLPPEPAVTFLTRLSGEVARHPTRLVAACLATVLGPGVVAYAGTADLHPPTPAVSGEQIATEAPSSVPQPGDPVTWQAAARAAAATCPGLPADVLVAIGRVESNLCLQAVPSQAGAEGPMQFLPSTWAAYGMDGDGDGRADVNDPVDALHGAARLLCATAEPTLNASSRRCGTTTTPTTTSARFCPSPGSPGPAPDRGPCPPPRSRRPPPPWRSTG